MVNRTPTVDETFEIATADFPGRPTRCRVRLFTNSSDRPIVVVTELAENEGESVTNAAESIWRALAQWLDATDFTMVEHYAPESFDGGGHEETFDLVTVGSGEPQWQSLGAEGLRRLLEG